MRKTAFNKFMFALFLGLTIFLFSFSNLSVKSTETVIAKSQISDTSVYIIIAFNPSWNSPFDKKYKKASLTIKDIQNIDSILKKSVEDHNSLLKGDNKAEFEIDLNKGNYKRQYVPVLNEKGEKEVWVNCFCSDSFDDHWKKEIVSVMDGGSCYFNFKINLATKKVYEFGVNGVA